MKYESSDSLRIIRIHAPKSLFHGNTPIHQSYQRNNVCKEDSHKIDDKDNNNSDTNFQKTPAIRNFEYGKDFGMEKMMVLLNE